MRIYDSRRNSELLTKVEEGKREVRRDGWERRGKARRKGEWEGAEEGGGVGSGLHKTIFRPRGLLHMQDLLKFLKTLLLRLKF